VLLPDASPAAVRAAIDLVMARSWDRDALATRAARFSRRVFADAFAAHVHGLIGAQSRPTTPLATSSSSSASTASASVPAPSRRRSGDRGAS
jgi:hypothetical protein